MRFLRPSGHLGDALVLSALLRARNASRGERFGIVRMSPFTPIFVDHPAVAAIGSPARGDEIADTDHWTWGSPRGGPARAFGKLSVRLFGEELPEEPPWCPSAPRDAEKLRWLVDRVAPVLLAADVTGARRGTPGIDWSGLAVRIRERWRVPALQVALEPRPPIDGTHNVTGRLAPRELVALVSRSQAVVAADPFVIAAASAASVPAIALLGTEPAETAGFPGQLSIQQADVGFPAEVGNLFDARLGAKLDPTRLLDA
jgi:hypothetical protein